MSVSIFIESEQTKTVNVQKRHTDRKMYFHDLEVTSKDYYIGYVSAYTTLTSESRILEVGCGEGGNLVPFAGLGCRVTGVDMAECRIKDARKYFAEVGGNAEFVCCDFAKYAIPKDEEEKYDVILLHDVIEHIPFKDKACFLKHIKAYLKERGILFVGFPAWQMPFGGHQQICRSKLCSHLPFIHLLPEFLYKSLLRLCGEEYGTVKELESIKECRTSIELFEALASDCGYLTVNKRYWLVNPHYKQKFNLTPLVLPHWIGRLKYIRNFFTTSCWYILR